METVERSGVNESPTICHVSEADKQAEYKKRLLFPDLASSDPNTSKLWYFVKHPYTRFVVALFVTIINFYVYLGDPASYSNSKSYGTLVGDIYHGWVDPDAIEYVLLRLCVMIGLMFLGIWLGLKLQQKLLRDYLHLKMFGFDDGLDPPVYGPNPKDPQGPQIVVGGRDPLSDQDGAFFSVFAITGMTWYVGLKIYNAILKGAGAADSHLTDAGMHGLTFAGYNLILAGLFAWVCDWYTLIAICDQMLQAIHNGGDSKGYHAYAHTGQLKKWGAWWSTRRVIVTRVLLIVGWPSVLIFYMVNFFHIKKVLGGEAEEEVTLGTSIWSAESNDEFTRMAAAAIVAFLNLVMVFQDWEFPDFSEDDSIKIVAVDFSAIRINFLARFCAKLPVICKYCPDLSKCILYISSKWFNYFGLMIGIAFDWGYWFMTALCFRPCDYAQLWESETGYIYSMTNKPLQDEHAGAAAAENCPWFTDNELIERYRSGEKPLVVKLEVGVFTGAYTVNEQDEYVFTSPKGAGWMWIMCLLPLFGWVVTLWLIFTHERVTCFNYKKTLDWIDQHGGHAMVDMGGGAVARLKRLAQVRKAATDMKTRREVAAEAPAENESCIDVLKRRLQYLHCCECICHRDQETTFDSRVDRECAIEGGSVPESDNNQSKAQTKSTVTKGAA